MDILMPTSLHVSSKIHSFLHASFTFSFVIAFRRSLKSLSSLFGVAGAREVCFLIVVMCRHPKIM